MNYLAPVFIIGIIILGILRIIQYITEYKLKKRLLDKAQVDEGFSSALAESLKTLSQPKESNPYPSLKWGLVTLGIGISLIVTNFMEFDYRSPLPFGLLLTGASLGFLIYYLIIITKEKRT